ncbi:MAG: hypothetical protein AAGA91_15030 [Pseudomonadota bacterium]
MSQSQSLVNGEWYLLMYRLFCVCCVLFSLKLSAQEPDRFNVPAGMVSLVVETPIEKTGGVSCDVDATPTGKEQSWSSSILMVFSSTENQEVTQVAYLPEGDMAIFIISTLNEPKSYKYRSEFLRLRRVEGLITLSAFWRDDSVIVYRGRDSSNQHGTGYILNPQQTFETLSVYASGVKGEMLCYEDEV